MSEIQDVTYPPYGCHIDRTDLIVAGWKNLILNEYVTIGPNKINVKSDNKKVSTVSAKTNKITTTNNSVKNLGVTYYIKEVPDMKDGKRNYTKPDHEVKFRDTYRHLKSGKVVYVKGGVRYKGKGTGEDIDKTYKI